MSGRPVIGRRMERGSDSPEEGGRWRLGTRFAVRGSAPVRNTLRVAEFHAKWRGGRIGGVLNQGWRRNGARARLDADTQRRGEGVRGPAMRLGARRGGSGGWQGTWLAEAGGVGRAAAGD
jgi:hypothetical protein